MDARQQRFLQLVEPHQAAALAFARCLCRSPADGDDLFQTALLRALEKLDHLREDGAFKTWFYRVIVSCHRNRVRRPFWARLVPLAEEPAGADRPIDEDLGGAQRARLALSILPPEQRETLVLFEIEEWSVEEIAAFHDVSLSAVKSRLSRGRERLRDFYTRRLGAAAPAALPSGGNP